MLSRGQNGQLRIQEVETIHAKFQRVKMISDELKAITSLSFRAMDHHKEAYEEYNIYCLV